MSDYDDMICRRKRTSEASEPTIKATNWPIECLVITSYSSSHPVPLHVNTLVAYQPDTAYVTSLPVAQLPSSGEV